MMATLQTAKKNLRQRIRKALLRLSPDTITNKSILVTDKLISRSEYRNAKRISVYLSMPHSEISTRAIVLDALKSGKEVFVPYIYTVNATSSQPKTSIMDMLSLNSTEEFENLKADKWGIPSFDMEGVSQRKNCFGGYGVSATKPRALGDYMADLDLIIMPGLAFDTGLRRLGHGKGYYDSFLKRYWNELQRKAGAHKKMPFLVALALEDQILPPGEEIPVGSHDWPVDAIIIGDGRLLTSQSGTVAELSS